MICTGDFGYLLGNGYPDLCFPVIRYIPTGSRRERHWAVSHGMAPIGLYTARSISSQRTMYISSLHWFDRNKKFLECWTVDRYYASTLVNEFDFYMKVDGV